MLRSLRPLTEIVILNFIMACGMIRLAVIVSFRPLTGIMILNGCEARDYSETEPELVSVPLRGLCFLIKNNEVTFDGFDILFPSPYGDYVS